MKAYRWGLSASGITAFAGAAEPQIIDINHKKGIKIIIFIHQRYEVRESLSTFADGSGQIGINYNILFATFRKPLSPNKR